MAKAINKRVALQYLDQAVHAKGANYVYVDEYGRTAGTDDPATCVNLTKAGEPACIVGHVFVALKRDGLISSAIPAGGYVSTTVSLFSAEDRAKFSPKAIKALTVAQCAQDHGATWGTAVDVAGLAVSKAKPWKEEVYV